MATINLELGYNISELLQIGDTVYACTPSASGDFSYQELSNATKLGTCSLISSTSIQVDTGALAIPLPTASDFIFFSKDNQTNLSSLKGYYAEVQFTNTSKTYAELFSVGTQVVESSK